MPGKNVKGKKKKEPSPEEEAERLALLKQQEEERKRKWEEAWDCKIRAEEHKEDCKACCYPDEYFRKPRTQTNIWLQITNEKNIQHAQMSIMNVPVPKQPCPPLPKPKETIEDNKDKKDKKKGKRKKERIKMLMRCTRENLNKKIFTIKLKDRNYCTCSINRYHLLLFMKDNRGISEDRVEMFEILEK